MKIKSLAKLTATERTAKLADIYNTQYSSARMNIAKIAYTLKAETEAEKSDLRAYVSGATGIDIKTDMSNVYDLINVIEAVDTKAIPLNETELDKLPSRVVVKFAGFLGKHKGKQESAIEILKSGSANKFKDLSALISPVRVATIEPSSPASGDLASLAQAMTPAPTLTATPPQASTTEQTPAPEPPAEWTAKPQDLAPVSVFAKATWQEHLSEINSSEDQQALSSLAQLLPMITGAIDKRLQVLADREAQAKAS